MRVRTLCWLLLAVLAIGCGSGDDYDRVAISGEVNFAGQALPNGSILLQPLASGPSVGGDITDGQFEIERARGPAPGSYRVEIISYQPTGRQIPDADRPGTTVDEMVQVIPESYNDNSQVVIEIAADGENHFDFAIEGAR
ncbi:MAG: hypothetical protein WD030_07645 [Pirellulales bacterium]